MRKQKFFFDAAFLILLLLFSREGFCCYYYSPDFIFKSCQCFDGPSIGCPSKGDTTSGIDITPSSCATYCGEPISNSCSYGPCTPTNSAPTATDVSISGTAAAGQTLTGEYTYSDSDTPPDPEDTSASGTKSGTQERIPTAPAKLRSPAQIQKLTQFRQVPQLLRLSRQTPSRPQPE